MGKALAEAFPTARRLYQEAGEILGYDLAKISFEGPEEELTQTRVCQPALYVHGYTVAQLLWEQSKAEDVGLCFGLSLGELTAHAVAGTFSFADGLRIVQERAEAMQAACEATDGAMASLIGGTPEEAEQVAAQADVDLANRNCPGQIVLSGARPNVEKAVEIAKEGSFKRVILLNVAGAYHSRLMQPARERFQTFLEGTTFERPTIPVIANADAEEAVEPTRVRESLTKQVTDTVRFEECLLAAGQRGITQFVECGTGKVLAGLVRRTNRDWTCASIAEPADIEAYGA